jgi:hypothetical protein
MTQASGATSSLSIGFESTAGTAATTGYTLSIMNETLSRKRPRSPRNVIRNSLNPSVPISGNVDISGQVIVPCDSIGLWYWLKALCNVPTTTGTDPYTHVFKIPAVATGMPFITIEKKMTPGGTDTFFQYTGVKIAGVSFDVGGEGELLLTFDVVGFNRTKASSTCFTTSLTSPGFAPLDQFHCSMEEGGSSFDDAAMNNYQISTNPDIAARTIGSGGAVGDITDNIWGVSGSLEMIYNADADTVVDKAINSTETSLKITAANGASSSFEALVPEVLYSENDPQIPGNSGIQASLDWEAYYENASEATAVQFTVINAQEHSGGN